MTVNETYELRIQSPLGCQRRRIVDVMKTLEVLLRYIGSGNILLQELIDSHLLHVVLHPLIIGGGDVLLVGGQCWSRSLSLGVEIGSWRGSESIHGPGITV